MGVLLPLNSTHNHCEVTHNHCEEKTGFRAQMENNGQDPMFIRGPSPLMQEYVTNVWPHTITAWEEV